MEVPCYVVRDSFGVTIAITVEKSDAVDMVNKFKGRSATEGKCVTLEINEESQPFYQNRS